jgi:hypothetical protein
MPRISNHAAWICGRDSKPVGPRLARDEIRSNGDREGTALPLPLAGEGWGGGGAAIHAVRVERVSPTRIASFDAMRPPPQAGEVQQVRGQVDSTKNHPALAQAGVDLVQCGGTRAQRVLAKLVERRIDGVEVGVQVFRLRIDVEQSGDDLALGGVLLQE